MVCGFFFCNSMRYSFGMEPALTLVNLCFDNYNVIQRGRRTVEAFVTRHTEAVVTTAAQKVHESRLAVSVLAMSFVSAAVLLTTCLNTANAAGASRGFEAKAGEIVLLQDVPKRSAVRPGYPGKSLLLDVSPVQQTDNIPRNYDLVEISDADAAVINTGATALPARNDSPLPDINLHSQNGPGGSSSPLASGMTGGLIMRNIGNVTRVTDGIAKQIDAGLGSLGTQNLTK